jgi:hypothetical protein
MNKRQLQIKWESKVDERRSVENIFILATEKFHLFDNTPTSRVPNTIKSIVERDGFGFAFGARVVSDLIIVDMFPRKSPSEQLFAEICNFLQTELFKIFPTQIREFEDEEPGFIPTYGPKHRPDPPTAT